jgi:DNA repair protein RecN (Recombination protein N)
VILQALSIRNVIVIERLDISFSKGFSVLTGETGAGKSILLDSIGFALGAKPGPHFLRQGSDKASVTLTFESHKLPTPIEEILIENDIPLENEGLLLIRRTLHEDGKSKSFLNDEPISLHLLKKIAPHLVDIHGQFDRFVDAIQHRHILDTYGKLAFLKHSVATSYRDWQDAEEKYKKACEALDKGKEDKEYIEQSLKELRNLNPQPQEEETLLEKRRFLMQHEKITSVLKEISTNFHTPQAFETTLHYALKDLAKLHDIQDNRIQSIALGLEKTLLEFSESSRVLESLLHDLEGSSDEKLDAIEQRLFALRTAARKHKCDLSELCDLVDVLTQDLELLDNSDHHLKTLHQAALKAKETYTAHAEQLRHKRQEVALLLEEKILIELPPLKLPYAQFKIHFDFLPETMWGAEGTERLEFYVTTNPGTPMAPIGKSASGGELSRIMLALKVVLAQALEVPVLIFDEVDSGMGGAVAAAVGERLHTLSQDVQVLAVTHAPQVAAYAHAHWHVVKYQHENKTTTEIHKLHTLDLQQEEIARMLSGAEITDQARAAALKLIEGKSL